MRTSIHSWETYLYKYLLPILFIPWDGVRSIRVVFSSITLVLMLLLIALWALLASIAFWLAVKLKTVVLDGEILYVKGYLKEVAIAFSDIVSIKYCCFMFPHLTMLRLKTPTGFGDKIIFISKRRIVTPAGPKSTFEELEARIGRAQA